MALDPKQLEEDIRQYEEDIRQRREMLDQLAVAQGSSLEELVQSLRAAEARGYQLVPGQAALLQVYESVLKADELRGKIEILTGELARYRDQIAQQPGAIQHMEKLKPLQDLAAQYQALDGLLANFSKPPTQADVDRLQAEIERLREAARQFENEPDFNFLNFTFRAYHEIWRSRWSRINVIRQTLADVTPRVNQLERRVRSYYRHIFKQDAPIPVPPPRVEAEMPGPVAATRPNNVPVVEDESEIPVTSPEKYDPPTLEAVNAAVVDLSELRGLLPALSLMMGRGLIGRLFADQYRALGSQIRSLEVPLRQVQQRLQAPTLGARLLRWLPLEIALLGIVGLALLILPQLQTLQRNADENALAVAALQNQPTATSAAAILQEQLGGEIGSLQAQIETLDAERAIARQTLEALPTPVDTVTPGPSPTDPRDDQIAALESEITGLQSQYDNLQATLAAPPTVTLAPTLPPPTPTSDLPVTLAFLEGQIAELQEQVNQSVVVTATLAPAVGVTAVPLPTSTPPVLSETGEVLPRIRLVMPTRGTIRSGPGLNFERLEAANAGEILSVLGQAPDAQGAPFIWYNVQSTTRSYTGWIREDLVSVQILDDANPGQYREMTDAEIAAEIPAAPVAQ